jgi:hypothetical protein
MDDFSIFHRMDEISIFLRQHLSEGCFLITLASDYAQVISKSKNIEISHPNFSNQSLEEYSTYLFKTVGKNLSSEMPYLVASMFPDGSVVRFIRLINGNIVIDILPCSV